MLNGLKPKSKATFAPKQRWLQNKADSL